MVKDYSKTSIYKLCCKNPEIKDCYVGHTVLFNRRKCEHKKFCNTEKGKEYNFKVYKFIRDNGGWINWDMIEIEKYPCNNMRQACARERYWLEHLGATLNCRIPNRSHKEWYDDNKVQIAVHKKLFYENNKEIYAQKKKIYRDANKETIAVRKQTTMECPCGSIFRHEDKARHCRTLKHQKFLKNATES